MIGHGSQWQKDMLKRCALSCDEKRQDMRGHRLIGVADYSRRQAQHCRMPDWRTSSDGYWGRDDSSCHSSVAVLLERRAEAGQIGLACHIISTKFDEDRWNGSDFHNSSVPPSSVMSRHHLRWQKHVLPRCINSPTEFEKVGQNV